MTNKEKNEIQKSIVSQIENPHGRLLLAPRVGKTKIAIMVIKKFKPNSILWVTPSAKLADKDIPGEFIKWKAKRYLKKLTTTTYNSLPKVEGLFDLIILDEEQALTERNYQPLVDGQLQYNAICSMTGTPTKHSHKLQLYKELKLEVLYEMVINSAVDLGLLANYRVDVLFIPYIKSMMKEYNRVQRALDSMTVSLLEFKEDHLVLKGQLNGTLGIVERPSKYGGRLFKIVGRYESLGFFVIKDDGSYTGKVTIQRTIYRITDNKVHYPYPPHLLIARKKTIGNSELKKEVAKLLLEHLKGNRKIVFTNSIEQAESLCEATYHSKTTMNDLISFQKEEVDTIAMVNAGGTGFTYKNLDNLIIVQCDSDKNGSTSQKICRTLLSQKNYEASIWILCIEDTQDEKWLKLTLDSFDNNKINYYKYNQLCKNK